MFPVGSNSRNCTVMLSKEKTERKKSFTVVLEAEDSHTVILTDSMRVHIEGECIEAYTIEVADQVSI